MWDLAVQPTLLDGASPLQGVCGRVFLPAALSVDALRTCRLCREITTAAQASPTAGRACRSGGPAGPDDAPPYATTVRTGGETIVPTRQTPGKSVDCAVAFIASQPYVSRGVRYEYSLTLLSPTHLVAVLRRGADAEIRIRLAICVRQNDLSPHHPGEQGSRRSRRCAAATDSGRHLGASQ